MLIGAERSWLARAFLNRRAQVELVFGQKRRGFGIIQLINFLKSIGKIFLAVFGSNRRPRSSDAFKPSSAALIHDSVWPDNPGFLDAKGSRNQKTVEKNVSQNLTQLRSQAILELI